MFYCRKCSRLLEEDLKKCPYCGNEEDDTEPIQNDTLHVPTDVDTQLEELNKMIDENKGKENQRNSYEEVQNGIYPSSPPSAPYVAVAEDVIGTGTKVLFILLSIFISPVAIIVGAIYLSKESRAYKSMGKTMLIVSIVSIVVTLICCCVFYIAAFSFANTAGYSTW